MSGPHDLIEDSSALAEVVARFASEARIGLDIEGDGLYRYRSRLCVVQLAGAEHEAVIDSLAIEDLSALAALLGDGAPRVVVHDVTFDAKMLGERGLTMVDVCDTSVAARFLGETNTGLASVLERHLGVTVEKAYQQADWGERPISDDRFDYLLSDVRHLPALSEVYETLAVEKDIAEEIAEETRYALAKAVEPEVFREPWTRVKGARDLGAQARSVLKALCDVRERIAEERDVPPFRVAHNRALHEAARRRPKNARAIRRIRGLKNMPDAALQEAIDLARERGPLREPTPAPAPPPEERRQRKAREKALSAWRRTESARRGVDAQVVLPGHCLRDLGGLRQLDREGLLNIAGFGEKRADLYGVTIVDMLQAADAGA